MPAFLLSSTSTRMHLLVATLVVAVAPAWGQEEAGPARAPDAPFLDTPQPAVEAMLKFARVRNGELVYDLGCGDGRFVTTAARIHGARGVGIDIDPKLVKVSQELAEKAGVGSKVTFRVGDIFEEDFSDADVITLFMFPGINERLKPQLLRLKPGARIVTYSFPIAGLKPRKVTTVTTPRDGERTLYLYVVPWEDSDLFDWTSPGARLGDLLAGSPWRTTAMAVALGLAVFSVWRVGGRASGDGSIRQAREWRGHVLFWTLVPPLLMMLEQHVLVVPEARAAIRASQEDLWKLWAGVLAAVLLVGRRSS